MSKRRSVQLEPAGGVATWSPRQQHVNYRSGSQGNRKTQGMSATTGVSGHEVLLNAAVKTETPKVVRIAHESVDESGTLSGGAPNYCRLPKEGTPPATSAATV